MKKVLIGVLALIMVLGIVGCSSTPATEETSTTKPTETTPIETESQTPEPTPGPTSTEAPSSWEIAHYVDDFGDETDEVYLQGVFSGEFSNTATTNSELSVIVGVEYVMMETDVTDEGYGLNNTIISFRLLEYNDHKATYNQGEKMTLKVKANDEISEYDIVGVAPNGDLSISGIGSPNAFDLETIWQNGGSTSCIIEIGSSKYSFEIDGAGYRELAEQYYNLAGQAAIAK